MLIAHCDATGVIKFSRKAIPEGSCEIMRGENKEVRRRMIACARHAYDGKTLLVPGIPEAENQKKGMDALLAFTKWINKKPTPQVPT